jgi:hypothetical protein
MKTQTSFTVLLPVKIEIGKSLHYHCHMNDIAKLFRNELDMTFKSSSHDMRTDFKVLTSTLTGASLEKGITEYTAKRDLAKTKLLLATLAWWDQQCPVSWSVTQHMDNPTVNCVTAIESNLAQAVANYLHVPDSKLPK